MLEHIKANVTKQYDQNKATEGKLRDRLTDFEDRLQDLDDAVKEAAGMVKKAKTQNGLNAQTLADLQVKTLQ